MAYKIIKKLPAGDEIIAQHPLSDAGYKSIETHKEEIRNILKGEDKRLLLIVGPCSAWPYDAVLEYASRLAKLSEQVKDVIKPIMRVYIQKPRTVKGWTGPVNQPDPLKAPDLAKGIEYARSLMVKVVEMGLPIADEALFTHNARGFLELMSWVAIGARSSEDQEHRIFASSIDCPVGIKNPTHGSLKIAVNGVIAAQHPHVAVFDGHEVETDGNEFAHLVLRGGDGKPNYSLEHIAEAANHLKAGKVKNPSIIVDVSHDNCLIAGKKDYTQQPTIIESVLNSLDLMPELRPLVKGFMLESFIKPGNQNAETASFLDMGGLSITDPCIGWEQTEELIKHIAKRKK
ncbi:MAG: 3-deoxy-7-phosphoheptulonate synthase [Burkholderiales bacterium]|jgi:3-deoxy-7-phosphoheptulonate synthase|nr:3-deoxy-7-phosphoheptulonate synthase [Burkholderiales bacterium]